MADINDTLVVKNNDFIHGGVDRFLVGESRKRCLVHKALLQRRALKIGKFKMALGDYYLDDVEPEIFELYVHHLYTGEIQCKMPHARFTEVEDDPQGNALVKLYDLADDLGDEISKHAVLGAFLEEAKKSHELGRISAPGHSAAKLACNQYSHEDPLYRLFVDMYIWDTTVQEDLCENLYENVARGFASEVMETACQKLQTGGTKSVYAKTCCDYHELKDGHKCGSKKRKRTADETEH